MKKKSKKWLTIFIVAFLGIIGLSYGHAHADDNDDYKINRMNVDVKILPNGDAEVTREVHYDFDSDYHGVYYRQELPGKGASDPSVSLNYIDDDNNHTVKIPINNSEKIILVRLFKQKNC